MLKQKKEPEVLKKVMVVDNDVDITNMVENALKKSGGYTVIPVNESNKVIGLARKYQPDLMLLDVAMPGVQGPEIAMRMSHDRNLKKIPIIFISGMLDQQDTGKTGRKIGRYMCLAKPFQVDDLIACMEKYRNQEPRVLDPG